MPVSPDPAPRSWACGGVGEKDSTAGTPLTIDHYFGASDIDRFNLFFLQLKEKTGWEVMELSPALSLRPEAELRVKQERGVTESPAGYPTTVGRSPGRPTAVWVASSVPPPLWPREVLSPLGPQRSHL